MSKIMSRRYCHIAWFTFGAMVLSGSVVAVEGDTHAIDEQYKRDVAACSSGQIHQDKRTCLKEAGAARQEARRHRLTQSNASYESNALQRCERLPAETRAACEMQIRGQHTTTQGSVSSGGVLRETTITVPVGTPGSTTVVTPPAGGYQVPGYVPATGGNYAPAPASQPSTLTPLVIPSQPVQPAYGVQPGHEGKRQNGTVRP